MSVSCRSDLYVIGRHMMFIIYFVKFNELSSVDSRCSGCYRLTRTDNQHD